MNSVTYIWDNKYESNELVIEDDVDEAIIDFGDLERVTNIIVNKNRGNSLKLIINGLNLVGSIDIAKNSLDNVIEFKGVNNIIPRDWHRYIHSGIKVTKGNKLIIYSNNDDSILNCCGMNESIISKVPSTGAGIGCDSNEELGHLIIKGKGTINATGGSINGTYTGAAGIGTAIYGVTVIDSIGGIIDIYGDVNIIANGGYGSAGIGNTMYSSGGKIFIHGNAKVIATGGQNSAGIGGGQEQSNTTIENNNNSLIRIYENAEVVANGVLHAAGIGGGLNGEKWDIVIEDNAKVTATGGSDFENYCGGAGIGTGGYLVNTNTYRAAGKIRISGNGQVIATSNSSFLENSKNISDDDTLIAHPYLMCKTAGIKDSLDYILERPEARRVIIKNKNGILKRKDILIIFKKSDNVICNLYTKTDRNGMLSIYSKGGTFELFTIDKTNKSDEIDFESLNNNDYILLENYNNPARGVNIF